MTLHRVTTLIVLAGLFSWTAQALAQDAGAGSRTRGQTGFLVLAPDRGFIGNREVQALVQEFKKDYPAALALIGREYTGVEGEYASYLSRAVQELRKVGIRELVVIPLFVSEADPLLKRIIPTLPAYTAGLPLHWAPPMAGSYLIGQILLDRVEAISEQPAQERLILLGIGATDTASEQALKADLDKLLNYIQRYKHFREAETVISYDREADGAEQKNQEIKAHLLALIAKEGRTLVVPAFVGPKFDHSMALTAWIGRQLKGLHVAYQGAELLPHPNVLLWLKKTANRFVVVRPEEIGVVIMPHGSTQPWNDAANARSSRLRPSTRSRWPTAWVTRPPSKRRSPV